MDAVDPPLQGDERTLLTTFLDFYRGDLLKRAARLDEAQLHQRHPPTTLTLARLISHMAYVEHLWFTDRFAGSDMPEPFADLDRTADKDADMTLAESWSVDELHEHFETSVTASQAIAASADGLDALSARVSWSGEKWNLRWILIHMIEEYARHCGHADLIRESIDGDVAS